MNRVVGWLVVPVALLIAASACGDDSGGGGSGGSGGGAGGIGGASGGGGGSSGATSCHGDPFSCGAGQTCWATANENVFGCMPAGSTAKGGSCTPDVGTADCAKDLYCFEDVESPTLASTCVAYCDPNDASHGCAAGETCKNVRFVGSPIYVDICVSAKADGG